MVDRMRANIVQEGEVYCLDPCEPVIEEGALDEVIPVAVVRDAEGGTVDEPPVVTLGPLVLVMLLTKSVKSEIVEVPGTL